jgi:SAM-dependent methyltransferase
MRDTVRDYDSRGEVYSTIRQPDPQIQRLIERELGAARRVLNIGAGTGSYEPEARQVVAVEPSVTMRMQRPRTLPPALIGVASSLPFDDDAFDAAMAILTVHHWPDLSAGLREVRRVTAGPVIVMSFDTDARTDFWMTDYVPEMADVERARYPSMRAIGEALGGPSRIVSIPVSLNCTDRFQVALYGRPEEFLREAVRRSQSDWSFLPEGVEARFVRDLSTDLSSGAWDAKYGHLRAQPELTCQLRLVVATKS